LSFELRVRYPMRATNCESRDLGYPARMSRDFGGIQHLSVAIWGVFSTNEEDSRGQQRVT
jgi:hypothetical protein